MDKDIVGQPNYLEEVCDTTFGNCSAECSLGCPNYRTTDKKTYFIVVSLSTRMKERSGVNSPPLDAPVMATLPGPAYLFLTRNWLQQEKPSMSLWNHDNRIVADIRSSNEIIKSISLLEKSRFHREFTKVMDTNLVFSTSRPVPFSTKFTSTPDIWNSQDCVIGLHKREHDWTKKWSSRNRESTITYQVKQSGC